MIKKICSFISIFILSISPLNSKAEEIYQIKCEEEIKKDKPDKKIVNSNCRLLAKKYENEKHPSGASFYYALAGEHTFNIEKFKNSGGASPSNVAHSYSVQGDFTSAKAMYSKFLSYYLKKYSDISKANFAMQEDYNLLKKIYPNQKQSLNKGLSLWNDIYKPYIQFKPLYQKFLKAKEDKNYELAIKHLSKAITLRETTGKSLGLGLSNNIFALGILYSENGQYEKSQNIILPLADFFKSSNTYKKTYINLLSWIGFNYKKLNKTDLALNANEAMEIAQIELSSNINNKRKNGYTPLGFAASKGYINVVKYLIQKGADVDLQGVKRNTPLYHAGESNHIKVVKYLFSKGAEINPKSDSSLLKTAFYNGQVELFHYLLKNGAVPEWIEVKGHIFSVNDGDGIENVTENQLILLNSDALKKVENLNLNSLLGRAIYRGLSLVVVEKFIKLGANFKGLTDDHLLQAITVSDVGVVKQILANTSFDLSNLDAERVFLALSERKTNLDEVIKLLLEDNLKVDDINLDKKNRNVSAILINALKKEKFELARSIVGAGANVNIKDEDGNPPIYYAVQKDLVHIVEFLIDAGADINYKNKERLSLYQLAIKNKKYKTVTYFNSRINFEAAKLAYNKKYKEALLLLNSQAKNTPSFLKNIVVPLSLEQKIINGEVTKKDAPFLASNFSFPENFNKKTIVKIINKNKKNEIVGVGSGFYIADDVILTNSHVINKGHQFAEKKYFKYIYGVDFSSSEKKYIGLDEVLEMAKPLKIIAEDIKHDLALLRIDSKRKQKIYKIERHNSNNYGKVFSIGYPLFNEDKVGKNLLKTSPYISEGYFHRIIYDYRLVSSAFNGAGASGSPLVNSCNQVIGVYTSGISGNGLIKTDENYYEAPGTGGGNSSSLALPEKILKFIENNSVFTEEPKNCLPFGVPSFENIKQLTSVIRFHKFLHSTALVISNNYALFIADNDLNIGDEAFLGIGSGVMGKVAKIDENSKIALFEINPNDESNKVLKMNLIKIINKHGGKGTNIALPVFSSMIYNPKMDLFYSAINNPGDLKKNKYLIKRNSNGKVYKKSLVFPYISGIFNGLNNSSKKLNFNYNKIDAVSSGAPIVNSLGHIEGIFNYNNGKTKVIESTQILDLLKSWGVEYKKY